MDKVRVVIAAAGTGTRAGLPYPKTLHPVMGKPILVHLIRTLQKTDPCPVVIVSPSGERQIAECLSRYGLEAELVQQRRPSGMGDAVLCFRDARDASAVDQLLLVWGDIPLLQGETVATLCAHHLAHGNDFTFATRVVDEAYTIVERDAQGAVTRLLETREAGSLPGPGERDIGLFIFRARSVLDLLDRRLPNAIGPSTGEHGFLYIVAHLVKQGCRVEAIPIATESDLISLNRLSDLAGVDELG